MSIIDDIRIKQDFDPEGENGGYSFEKDAPADESKSAEDSENGHAYYAHFNIAAPPAEDVKKALDAAQAHIEGMFAGGAKTGRWNGRSVTGRKSSEPEPQPMPAGKTFKDLVEEARGRRATWGAPVKLETVVEHITQEDSGDPFDPLTIVTYHYFLKVHNGAQTFEVSLADFGNMIPDSYEYPAGEYHHVDASQWDGRMITARGGRRKSVVTPVSFNRYSEVEREQLTATQVALQSANRFDRAVEREAAEFYEMDFAAIEQRILEKAAVVLDMETRSQVSLDPGACEGSVMCYAVKRGDGEVITFTEPPALDKEMWEGHWEFDGPRVEHDEG